jgi:hypothetical protein
MRRFKIETDPRVVARRVRTAIQGSAIRALVELVTNCDHSYRRLLEGQTTRASGRIDVLYEKESYCGRFAVRDEAAGMSCAELSHAFEKYGAATSGYKDGEPVTGFFGTGAKNALGGMTDGRICTFKDNVFTECRVFLERETLMGEIEEPQAATAALRSKHGIEANGTVAYFSADPGKGQRVPQFDTVHEYLANHWRLRKIMTNWKRNVALINITENAKKRVLSYGLPKGRELLAEEFPVLVDAYGEFPIRISVWRAESELSQTGEQRRGGLLILDDAESVLDMSLFRYDNEPLASRFFGEVVIGRFRDLLAREAEEPVLKEEREGLDRSHPVCRAIVSEIEKRIEGLVKEEQRFQREARTEIDSEESTRYKTAFRILNEIAQTEVEVENLGQEPTDELEPPPNGLGIYPDSAHITVGKRYNFQIRTDARVVRAGSVVKVSCSTAKVRLISAAEFSVPRAEDGDVAKRYVRVEGTEPGARATLLAATGQRTAEATIIVDPEKEEKEDLLKEGLVFRPQSLTVRMNSVRKAVLLVYVKIVQGGSKVVLSSDSESVHVWPESVIVNAADARRHVAEYPVEVWGDRPNATATVTAETDGSLALLDVRVRDDQEEKEKKERGKGMFSEPHFDLDDPEPLQRSSYSRETGRVTIHANFPSVKHYLGDGCRHKKTLAAQVLIADLVAERCFLEVARQKVDRSGAVLGPGEARTARIESEAQQLSKKHGHRVHRALVDQTLLQQDRGTVAEQAPAKQAAGGGVGPVLRRQKPGRKRKQAAK